MKKIFGSLFVLVLAMVVGTSLSNAADPEITGFSKFSDTQGGFEAVLGENDAFGHVVVNVGDVDNNGINDIAVGVPNDDDGGADRGAVYILFLDSDGTLSETPYVKFSDTAGGFEATLDDGDGFGGALAAMGDVNGDSVPDLAVGATGDDDGGAGRGAVYILHLDADATLDDSVPYAKFSDTAGGFTATLENGYRFGEQLANLGDVNGDDIPDLAVGVPEYGSGVSQKGGVFVLYLDDDGTLHDTTPFSQFTEGVGGFAPSLDSGDKVGIAIANAGDINNDGINEIAATAYLDDDGGTSRGAVYILVLDSDGTLDDTTPYVKFSDTAGGFEATLDDNDYFGLSVAGVGDVNGDGSDDIVVGAGLDDDGGSERGAVYLLMLDSDGTLDDTTPYVKFSDTAGGFEANFSDNDRMGFSVMATGDMDGNNVVDFAVSFGQDWGMGVSRKGEVYILFLESNGTLVEDNPYLRIGDGESGFDEIDNQDLLGATMANMGDIDSNGTVDFALGASGDADGGSSGRGAVYLTFLDGGVEETSSGSNPAPTPPPAPVLNIFGDSACTWDNTLYAEISASNVASLYLADNERFTGTQQYMYQASNGSTVLPEELQGSMNPSKMYIAWTIPDTVEEGSIYELFAITRSSNNALSPIVTDSIRLTSVDDCDYPYPATINEDGEIEEDPDPVTEPVACTEAIPLQKGDLISLSTTTSDLTNEFYVVDQDPTTGELVKRADPGSIDFQTTGSWRRNGEHRFITVNQVTLDSLPDGEPMMPEGPRIIQFTDDAPDDYYYILGDNSAPRPITAELAAQLSDRTISSLSFERWIINGAVSKNDISKGAPITAVTNGMIRQYFAGKGANGVEVPERNFVNPEDPCGDPLPFEPYIFPVEQFDVITVAPGISSSWYSYYVMDKMPDYGDEIFKRTIDDDNDYRSRLVNAWEQKNGHPIKRVNQATIDYYGHHYDIAIPPGPAILLQDGFKYFYVNDANIAREITTNNLQHDLFGGTNWQPHVWNLPATTWLTFTLGRDIVRYERDIVVEWRNYIRGL